MVVDFLVTAIFSVLNSLLSLAPAWSMPGTHLAVGIRDAFAFFSYIIPVGDAMAILIAGVAMSVSISAWNLVMFVYNKIPWLAHS